jgi:hypothetical protein
MSAAAAGLSGLVAVLAGVLGPLAALIALLNRRDRRAAQLLGAATAQFPALIARSAVHVAVRCGLFSRRATVTVDLWPCAADELWAATARLRRALPPEVRLSIRGEIGQRLAARVRVDAEPGPVPVGDVSASAAC